MLLAAALAASAMPTACALRVLPARLQQSKPGHFPAVPRDSNSTAAMYNAFKRDIIFFERFAFLLYRTTSKCLQALQTWLARSLGIPPRVMVVRLSGVIAADDDVRLTSYYDGDRPDLLRAGMDDGGDGGQLPRTTGAKASREDVINLARVDKLLTRAFTSHGARAVVLLINSPGGSPAQSSLIYQRLRALRKQHKRIPLIAFVEDAAVSGGYYIASAADEIVADPSSLVGSIGVISRGFGYVKAIKKQGVTRRVATAGESKSGIDPYMPQRSKDLKSQKRLLHEIHHNFIDAVKQGRGDRLKPEEAARLHVVNGGSGGGCVGACFGTPSRRRLQRLVDKGAGLFDGSVYSGEVGRELGLVDSVGEMRTEMQKRFGRHVRLEAVEEEFSKMEFSRLLRWLL